MQYIDHQFECLDDLLFSHPWQFEGEQHLEPGVEAQEDDGMAGNVLVGELEDALLGLSSGR